jgi:hypothetical protein
VLKCFSLLLRIMEHTMGAFAAREVAELVGSFSLGTQFQQLPCMLKVLVS